jgi:hypothetical protein
MYKYSAKTRYREIYISAIYPDLRGLGCGEMFGKRVLADQLKASIEETRKCQELAVMVPAVVLFMLGRC